VVLVVAAIGGGAFLLTSGDDDDSAGGSTTTNPDGGQVTTLPGNPGTTQPGGGSDPTDTPVTTGDTPVPSGDVLATTASWVYSNTPGSVDQEESTCIAGVVIGVVGEDRVAQAGGNLLSVYATTGLDEDATISSGISQCVDSESAAELNDDPAWPWPV